MRLWAAWEAHPAVEEAREQMEAHAWRNDLKFDKAGMDSVLRAMNEHMAEHGFLPESGIKVG